MNYIQQYQQGEKYKSYNRAYQTKYYQQNKERRNAYFRHRNWRLKVIELGGDFMFNTDTSLFD
jgi:hypothetical protein